MAGDDGTDVLRWKGADDAISAGVFHPYRGRGLDVVVRRRPSPDFGWGVTVGDRLVAIVVVPTNSTAEDEGQKIFDFFNIDDGPLSS